MSMWKCLFPVWLRRSATQRRGEGLMLFLYHQIIWLGRQMICEAECWRVENCYQLPSHADLLQMMFMHINLSPLPQSSHTHTKAEFLLIQLWNLMPSLFYPLQVPSIQYTSMPVHSIPSSVP